jgi:hypothetical protein
MRTLSPQTETYMYGMVTPGMTSDRLSARKVTLDQLVQPVHKVLLVQPVLSVRLQLTTQLHPHLQKLVTRGLTQLMEKFMSTTIHIGLRLVPHL